MDYGTHQMKDVSASDSVRVALLLLFGAYAQSITDRMILSVLFEPIRLEFGATDTQMGLLGGLSLRSTRVIGDLQHG